MFFIFLLSGLLIILQEYFFPTGEGYLVMHYMVNFVTKEITSTRVRSNNLFAFKISAILYKTFKAPKGSFIEYHAR